jgi:hypothetical protein
MAKRRRKKRAYRRTSKPARRSYRRRGGGGGGRRRRRGGGGRRRGGGGGGIMPSHDEMKDMAAAGVYGFLEGKAKKDDSFILNKLAAKSPLPMIGFTGNVALAARIANRYIVHNPMLGRFAQVTGLIACYQMARQGSLFTTVAPFTVSGELDDDAMAGELDDDAMGALAADADAHNLEGDFDDGIEGDEGLDIMAGEDDY